MIKFEGCITSVENQIFKANLIDEDSNISEMIEAEFEICDLIEEEKSYVHEGVIFDWYIDEDLDKDYLIFRKNLNWQGFDVNQPSKLADQFYSYFSPKKE